MIVSLLYLFMHICICVRVYDYKRKSDLFRLMNGDCFMYDKKWWPSICSKYRFTRHETMLSTDISVVVILCSSLSKFTILGVFISNYKFGESKQNDKNIHCDYLVLAIEFRRVFINLCLCRSRSRFLY